MLGDQVYADEVSPKVKEFIEERRGDGEDDEDAAPLDQVADFEEYTRLYWEAWSDPVIRWLLSTVSTSMIFDDHDVHDDWNISRSWVSDMRGKKWWHDRITGGFMSYWIYQHLGNLSPAELAEDDTFQVVTSAPNGDISTRLLREFAIRADRRGGGNPVELLPRHRRHPGDHDGLARGPVPDARPPLDLRRRRVGLDRRARQRRLRPPRDRHLAAVPARPGDALRRGVERGGLQRRLGRAGRARRRVGAARARPRALGRVRACRSTGSRSCSRRSAPASAASRRPRSS